MKVDLFFIQREGSTLDTHKCLLLTSKLLVGKHTNCLLMRNITPIAAGFTVTEFEVQLLKENFFQKLFVQLTVCYNTEP